MLVKAYLCLTLKRVLTQVWGTDADGAIHNPPTDVVWRNQGTWGCGSSVVTKLLNKAGEVNNPSTRIVSAA